MREVLALAVLWALWCALHSVLISRPVTEALARAWPGAARFQRLIYNLIAVVTLLPLLKFSFDLRGDPFFAFPGAWILLRLLLLAAALLLFVSGARGYELRRFLGLTQLREGRASASLAAAGGLRTDGVLNITRHPWYLGGILLIWARNLDGAALTSNLVLTAYFVIGARLEEAKLLAAFGEDYRRYRERVSMLLPLKALKAKLRQTFGAQAR